MKFEAISYDHAARLIERSPWEVSRDAALLAEAQMAAMDTYGRSESIVGLDIYNVEIEACGCEIIEPPGNGMPSAGDPPFNSLDSLAKLKLDPDKDGRIPMILEAAGRIAEARPDASIRIPISGPFTIACHLVGMENMIIELFSNPGPAAEVLEHLAENQLAYGRKAVERGFKVSLFESSVTPPLVTPAMFAGGAAPALKRIIEGLCPGPDRDIQLIIGGDTLPIMDQIIELGPSYIICPVETDQSAFMERAPADGPAVRVNMSPAVFLPGGMDAAKAETQRVLSLAEQGGDSIGALVPFEADIEIVREISRQVNDYADRG